MSRKKKNAAALILLLLALALLICFYIWYVNRDKKTQKDTDESDSSDSPIELVIMDTELINELHLINENTDIKLVLKEGTWIAQDDPERPINQSNVKSMINIIDQVNALRIINENPDDLSEYGLDKPLVYIQAVQSDGKTLTIKVGSRAVGASGNYALVNEDKTVYLLISTFETGLDYTDAELTDLGEVPDINAEEIYHIEVLKRDGDDFELLYDPDNAVIQTGVGLYSWMILKPYERPYAAEGYKVSELQPTYAAIDFTKCVDYKGSNPAEYGLDDPIASIFVEYYVTITEELEEPETDPETGNEVTTRTYQEPHNIKLYIGNADEEGNYYVRMEGSNPIYTMSKDKVDKMLNTDPFSIISSFISIPNIETVDKVDILIEGQPYTMEIKRETVKNEEGKDETRATYYYNGNEVEEKAFKGVYQVLIAAGFDAEIKKEIAADNIEPYLVITYHFNDESKSSVTTSYLPYDESFYIVDTGDVIRFFADKREIDDIAKSVIEFKGKEY
jgi:hypothetical protein